MSRECISLFRAESLEVIKPNSFARRKLNYTSLVFSHLLAEISAIMKDGVIDHSFVINKREGREFWRSHFAQT